MPNTTGMGNMFDDWIVKLHHQKMPILQQADKIGVSVDFIKRRRKFLGLSVPKAKAA